MRLRPLVIAPLVLLVSPPAASGAFLHTVMPGESLTSIAAADGLSVGALAAANGLAPDAQLIAGSTVSIPPQSGPFAPSAPASPQVAEQAPVIGDGDTDSDDPAAPSVESEPVGNPLRQSSPGYTVQPGDTLTAIAARSGLSVSELATANGLDPNGVLLAGSTLTIPGQSLGSSAPQQAPAVGTPIVGRMTWFGGPHDPSAQGVPASGLGFRNDGMAFYNYGSLGHRWLIRFPWGETLPMTQIDIGPAPWTGNAFDIAFSALPNTPYDWRTWPNPTVTGIYQGP